MAALAVMATYVDFRAMWREIVAADKRFALLGLLAHYATYYFRGARWKFVLGSTPRRASRPWPISRRFGPLINPVSPTQYGGKL